MKMKRAEHLIKWDERRKKNFFFVATNNKDALKILKRIPYYIFY